MRSLPFVISALGVQRQKLKVKQSYTVRAFLTKTKTKLRLKSRNVKSKQVLQNFLYAF